MAVVSEAQAEADIETPAAPRPWTTVALDLARRQPVGTAGPIIVVVMIVMAVFAEVLTSYDPTENAFGRVPRAAQRRAFPGAPTSSAATFCCASSTVPAPPS